MATLIATSIGRVQPRFVGEYSTFLTYEKLDNVLYDGCTYIAKQNVPAGQTPDIPNSEYWQLVAEKGDQGVTGGFGTPTASATNLEHGQTPTVNISTSGPDTAKIFNFEFGIPAGPVGFDAVNATAEAISAGSTPTVQSNLTESGDTTTLNFAFGIPAADGSGVAKIDNVGPSGTERNVIYNGVRAVQNQGLSTEQQQYARENINAQVAGDYQPAGNYIADPSASADQVLYYNSENQWVGKSINEVPSGSSADAGKFLKKTSNSYEWTTVNVVTTDRTINGKALSSNITLTYSDVGAVPTSRKINNKSLNSNITLSASDVSAVPLSRTINGQELSANITLGAADVGAVPTSRTINGVALSSNIVTRAMASNVSLSTSAWSSASTPSAYVSAGYPYRASITINGVTENMIPQVSLGLEDSISGNFAPIAETTANKVYIYAASVPSSSMLIPSIICHA